MTDYLTNGQSAVSTTVVVAQRQDNWQLNNDSATIQIAADIGDYADPVTVSAKTTGNYTVTVDASCSCSVN